MKRFDQRLDAAESCVPPEPSFWARLARAAPFITRPEEGTIREICRRAGIPDDMPADSNWSLIPAADIERIELIVAAAERCDHWLLELDELDRFILLYEKGAELYGEGAELTREDLAELDALRLRSRPAVPVSA